MAPIISQLCFAVFIYCLVVLCLCDAFVSASDAIQDSDAIRRPMILPLYLSSPKSSHYNHRRAFDGRRLQKSELPRSPYARMRLYDDLLTNGYLSFYPNFPQIIFLRKLFRNSILMMLELKNFFRYYTTRLSIGTPPQEFALIVDTGSTVTYVPCSDCKHCGKHQVWLR